MTVAPELLPLPAGAIDEQELTRQALAAHDEDLADLTHDGSASLGFGGGAPLLPAAYMPAPMAGPRPTWLRVLALVLVAAFVVITAAGFCITYGALSFA